MQNLKNFFAPFVAILKFINTYFKACLFLLVLFLIFSSQKPDKIANLAEISINQTIADESEILEQIYQISKNENIKGVLLNVDSPGGTLASSVELSVAIKNLNQIKPVVAYASGTMASGSYYASIWASRIYANKGSFIGSIGVIMQGVDVSELANKVGVKPQIVSAGSYKEVGTFARKWSENERKFMQNLANESYEMFIGDVAEARKLDKDNHKEWADAKVFLAQKAASLNLIDGVSSYFEAKDKLAQLSGVENQIWLEEPAFNKVMNKLTKTFINISLDTILKFRAF